MKGIALTLVAAVALALSAGTATAAKPIRLPRHGKTPIGAFYSPGVFTDGGGRIIYPGHDGQLHVKYVPPRAPVMVAPLASVRVGTR